MKKTILALTVTSLFSVSAIASQAHEHYSSAELEEAFKASQAAGDIEIEKHPVDIEGFYVIRDTTGALGGDVFARKTKNGYEFSGTESGQGEIQLKVVDGKITKVRDSINEGEWHNAPVKPSDSSKPNDNTNSRIDKIIADNNIEQEREGSSRYRVNAGEYTGYTIDTRNGRVEDKFGNEVGTLNVDKNGNITISGKDRNGGNNSSDLRPVNPIKPIVAPVTEIKASDIAKAAAEGYDIEESKGNFKITKGGNTQAVVTKNGDGTYTVVDANTGERFKTDIVINDDRPIFVDPVDPVKPDDNTN